MQSHYNFAPGLVLARKYEVLARVRSRRSGELYALSERATGIERTAKFFTPDVDPNNRCANSCARKLHRLRHCDILVQYRTQETISVDGRDVTFLVADSVNGRPLDELLKATPGGKLSWFEGLHLLHALALGVEKVHRSGEAHGELTLDNVVVRRRGLGFHVKLLDLEPGQRPGHVQEAIRHDVYDMVHLFHEAIGGTRAYARHPGEVKSICCGMRRAAILERFRHAGELRQHLENLAWS